MPPSVLPVKSCYSMKNSKCVGDCQIKALRAFVHAHFSVRNAFLTFSPDKFLFSLQTSAQHGSIARDHPLGEGTAPSLCSHSSLLMYPLSMDSTLFLNDLLLNFYFSHKKWMQENRFNDYLAQFNGTIKPSTYKLDSELLEERAVT